MSEYSNTKQEQKGNKIDKDKYYTPIHIAELCYNKAIEVIGKENITSIVEPSAGAGVFLDLDESIVGYDIAPEDPRVREADYLQELIGYKKGRLIIGNPPFGRALNLAQKFYKKAITEGDYIAFILPISQLENNITMFEFDLVESIDLGKQEYSDRNLHCCFNIYKRADSGEYNKRPSNRCKDIKIIRQDSKGYAEAEYDIRMCYWGNGTAGKLLQEGESYSGEYKIQIHTEERKDSIREFIEGYDWNGNIKGIAMKRIKQYQIIEALKENVAGFK